jgi:hypothetical protein
MFVCGDRATKYDESHKSTPTNPKVLERRLASIVAASWAQGVGWPVLRLGWGGEHGNTRAVEAGNRARRTASGASAAW